MILSCFQQTAALIDCFICYVDAVRSDSRSSKRKYGGRKTKKGYI